MTPEQKLSALFAAEAPAARDYAFQARMAQAVALRRAWMTVAALVPWVIAAVAGLWGLRPVVRPIVDSLSALGPAVTILAAAAVTVASALTLARRWGPGGFRPPA